MDSIQAWCMKCSAIRTIEKPKIKKMGNGRHFAQGKCPMCGQKVNKIVSVKVIKSPDVSPPEVIEVEALQEAPVDRSKPSFVALCRLCGVEREIIGKEYATLWNGKKVVVDGRCSFCGATGNFLNAREVEDDRVAD